MRNQCSAIVSQHSNNPADIQAEPAHPESVVVSTSGFSRAARKLLSPALIVGLLASPTIVVLPALHARRLQATEMPREDIAKYLPSGSSPIRSVSGVMIHNAGSDVGRSDTSVFLSNQHQSTVAILDSLPALGAQMDPYKLNGEWYVRHQAGDGSPPLRLADELNQINTWLEKNPDRIFVLDFDTYQRLASDDFSLAEVVKSSFGSKLLMDTAGKGFFTVKDALALNKQLVLSGRAASIAGFNREVNPGAVVQPSITHVANLTPVYTFLRGLPPVDQIAFESSRNMVRDHFETPQEILEHVKEPGTQVLLDQMNLASFVEPIGLESDPVFMSGYPESETARKATLGATSGAAVVSALAAFAVAVMAKRGLPLRAGLNSVQLTSAVSNCALTLATVFPGLRQQLGIFGLVTVAAGFIATVGATRISQHALNATVGEDDIEQQVGRRPTVSTTESIPGGSLIDRLSEGTTAYHVLTRFASLAKYKIPATLPALGAMNLLLAGKAGSMKVELHDQKARQALLSNPEQINSVQQQLKNDIRRQGWKSGFSMAGMVGSMGIVMPAQSGLFVAAAAVTPLASRAGAEWFARKKARLLNV